MSTYTFCTQKPCSTCPPKSLGNPGGTLAPCTDTSDTQCPKQCDGSAFQYYDPTTNDCKKASTLQEVADHVFHTTDMKTYVACGTVPLYPELVTGGKPKVVLADSDLCAGCKNGCASSENSLTGCMYKPSFIPLQSEINSEYIIYTKELESELASQGDPQGLCYSMN